MKSIVLNGEKINYELKQSTRSKGVRISINHVGEVTLTISPKSSEAQGIKFLEKKAEWIIKTINKTQGNKDKIYLKASIKDYKKLKEETRKLVTERVEHFNKFYKFKYKRISIRNQKSRWGSCSSKGNLNFNYRLIHLPLELLDYVVVHELCHLKEMNHSRKFWDLVGKGMPDFKLRLKRLKKEYLL